MADFPNPAWRDKNKIGNLMSRLAKHADGEIEMTPSQIQAAALFLKKTLPDLQSIQHSGDAEGTPIKTSLSVVFESASKTT